MAQKVQVSFTDDIDGSEAEGTIRFELDGTSYEIDLNAANAAALRKTLAKYIEHARKAAGSTRRTRHGSPQAPGSGLNASQIRQWASAQGIKIKDRGRIPADVIDRYEQATGK